VVAIATTGYNPAFIIGGLIAGPLFGLLGQRWRIRRSWVSAALVAGALCLEPLALLATGHLANRAAIVWRVEVLVGTVVAALFTFAILARRRAGAPVVRG
jgi:hypothetical protein